MRFVIPLLLVFIPHILPGQLGLSVPEIINFSKEEYRGGPQNWEVVQDAKGRLWVANNVALLAGFGNHWEQYSLPNSTIVRSLEVVEDFVYVGGQGEMGRFQPDENGFLEYRDLLPLLGETEKLISDIWDITRLESVIYFATRNRIYGFTEEKLEWIYTGEEISFSGLVDGRYIFFDKNKGLFEIDRHRVVSEIELNLPFKGAFVNTILEGPNSQWLFFTNKNGIWIQTQKGSYEPWLAGNQDFWQDQLVSAAMPLDSQMLAIGTESSGLVFTDYKGNILQNLTIRDGLQSNNLICFNASHQGDLWVGGSKGIDLVRTSSPVQFAFPDGWNRSRGYDACLFNEKMYWATSAGLFVSDWSQKAQNTIPRNFQAVRNSEGQVWGLKVLNDKLFMNHNEGLFFIRGNEALPLNKNTGTWETRLLNDSTLIAGGYKGLDLYERTNGRWNFVQTIENMPEESCRFVEMDSLGYIWISHPYRGIYRIMLTNNNQSVRDIKLYGEKEGLPSSNRNHVFKIADQLVFAGEKGIFRFDYVSESFKRAEFWEKYFASDRRIKFMTIDPQGNIWFVEDEQLGVLWVEDLGLEKQVLRQILELDASSLVGGFEKIIPIDEHQLILPGEEGFMLVYPQRLRRDTIKNFQTSIVSVELSDSSYHIGAYRSQKSPVTFSAGKRSISFQFAGSDYTQAGHTSFQYRLSKEGSAPEPWQFSAFSQKEFTGLEAGDYVFEVVAISKFGYTGKSAYLHISVIPLWYQRTGAKVLFTLLIVSLLMGGVYFQNRRFNEEKDRIKKEQQEILEEKTAMHQREMEKTEAQILKLEQEKLEAELKYKNQELASISMHLVQKGTFLKNLKSELEMLKSEINDSHLRKNVNSIIRKLEYEKTIDEGWDQYSMYFDQIHNDFLKKLQEKHPTLTATHQRLCTYLKMNLSTKEIAPLMNISVRGVEISRYRLRKKTIFG